MNLLPTEQDRQPLQARFWVSQESGGMIHVDVQETDAQVDERLKQEFLLYRLRKAGTAVINKMSGSMHNEV